MKKLILCLTVLLAAVFPAYAAELETIYADHVITAEFAGAPEETVTAKLQASDGKLIDIRQARTDETGKYRYQFTFDEEKRDTYTLKIVSETEAFEEQFYYEGAAGNEFLYFNIDSVPGVISGNQITVTLSDNSLVSQLCPVFEVSAYASVTINGSPQQSGSSKADFSSPVVYTVTSGGGDAREYTVAVTVKNSSKPPKGSDSGGGGGGRAPVQVSVPAISVPEQKPESRPDESKQNPFFADVAREHWAYDYIAALKDAGVVAEAETFVPERAVTRAEFVKMLVMALELYDAGAECDFVDIDNAPWSEKYIASAVKAEIVNGVGNGMFGVNEAITREDMAVMCARALKMEAAEPDFADDDSISGYAREAVGAMQKAEILNGYENKFMPKNNASRAETAKIIYMLMKNR